MEDGSGIGVIAMVLYLALVAFYIAVGWRIFTKAGQPGWASIIPIYNLFVFCKIVGRPGWWVILALIPGVNIVIGIIWGLDLAKSFGKGTGFAVGLILLGFIFGPILAFGDAEYQGPAAGEASAGVAPAT